MTLTPRTFEKHSSVGALANIRNELHSLLSTHDVVFKSLNDGGKIRYLFSLENEITSKIVGKYTYLMFQKRKDILNAK